MKIFNNRFWLPVLLVILVAVNWLASSFHARIDLTNEKRFTLSSSSKKILKELKEPVTVSVLLHGKLNSAFKQLSSSADDLLNEFKEVAGNKIHFKYVNADEAVPGGSSTYGDTSVALGMIPYNLTSQVKEGQEQQLIYPFALVQYGDTIVPAKLYSGKAMMGFADIGNAEALLEYHLIEAIAKASRKNKSAVGYALGNGEPQDYRTYDLVENVLKPNYDLFLFDLNKPGPVPADFKTLIIDKPATGFSDLAKLKLDQYVMNGGKLLIFADRLNAEMDSLAIKNQVIAFDRDLKLNDLLFNYGVRINADLVMDLQCDFLPFDVNGNGQYDLLPWNYFPKIISKNNHPINKGLGEVAGKFVNSLDTVEAEGIKKTVILSSSENARTIGSPAIISGAETANKTNIDRYTKADIILGVLLEGKFRSMFANRLTAALSDSLALYNAHFTPQSVSEGKIIVVGDGDMILNNVWQGNPLQMGKNPYTIGTQQEVQFANRDLVLNCLDYLVDEYDLGKAKSKEHVPMLLNIKKTEEEKFSWQLINLGLPMALVLILAVIFSFLRKRKYAKRS